MTFKGRCEVGWGRNECYCSLDKERKRGQQVQHTEAQRWKGVEYSGNGEETAGAEEARRVAARDTMRAHRKLSHTICLVPF